MTDRYYRRNGGPPEPLPTITYAPDGFPRTDLANNPEGREACGFIEGPPPPDVDPATHAVRWDGNAEQWVIEALPPAPPQPPPPMPDISDRQFGEGLWRDDLIDFDAYLAFVGPGVIPAPLMAIIEQLPDDDTGKPTPRKVALGLVTGAKSYEFANPFVEIMRQAFAASDPAWTVEHLRERWRAWSAL